jgi:predicted RNA binding protein YcfA (HicA-like mRNA interferase family)
LKLPRDITGNELVKKLGKLGYSITRQSGSHIRLTKIASTVSHHITIPNHSPIKIGTLSSIIKDVAEFNSTTKENIIERIF